MSRCHRPRLPANTFPVSRQQGDSLQDEPLREAQVYCQMLNINLYPKQIILSIPRMSDCRSSLHHHQC